VGLFLLGEDSLGHWGAIRDWNGLIILEKVSPTLLLYLRVFRILRMLGLKNSYKLNNTLH